MKKLLIVTGAIALVLAVSAQMVIAFSNDESGLLDRQSAIFRTSSASTTDTAFHDLTGMGVNLCALNEVSATLSVKLSGAPAAFQIRVDGGGTMIPGAARFVPAGTEDSGSFTFVANAQPFEANDHHFYQVEWRSVTGGATNVLRAVLNLQYQDGTACG